MIPLSIGIKKSKSPIISLATYLAHILLASNTIWLLFSQMVTYYTELDNNKERMHMAEQHNNGAR